MQTNSARPRQQLVTPHAPEAEAAVLGAMLQDPIAVAIAYSEKLLRPEHFYEPRNAQICEAVYRQFAAGHVIDEITIANDLRRHGQIQDVGGSEYLDHLKAKPATIPNIETYIRDIQNASTKRRSLGQLEEAKAMACNGVTPHQLAEFVQGVASQIKEDATATGDAARPRFELIGAPAFKNRQPPTFLIDGVLPENSLSGLVGPFSTFKSFMGVGIAACVATGLPWHGRAVNQAPTVYISGEGSGGLGARLRAWEIANDTFLPESFTLLPEAVQLHNPDDVTALIAAIRAMPEPPGLIVIDTLARCLVGGDENSARDMGLFIAGADRLRTATGAHVMVIHHVGKSGDTRGSTALPGAMDTMIGIERHAKELTLSCMKQKDAPEFEPMGFTQRVVELTTDGSETSLVFDATGAPAKKANAKMQAALDLLATSETGMKASEWMELCIGTGMARRSFYNYRDELVQSGRIVKALDSYVVVDRE